MPDHYCSFYQLHSTSLETITSADNSISLEKIASVDRRDIVMWYCDVYWDVTGSSHTKEIEKILKAWENVGVINQSKRSIEPCDYSSQSIFVKKLRERLGKSMFRITDIRSRQIVEVEGLISCPMRLRNIELVFWYLFVALGLT